jgi:hypothetical protein
MGCQNRLQVVLEMHCNFPGSSSDFDGEREKKVSASLESFASLVMKQAEVRLRKSFRDFFDDFSTSVTVLPSINNHALEAAQDMMRQVIE